MAKRELSLEEVIKSIYNHEAKYWVKMLKNNPEYVVMKLVIMCFNEKMSGKNADQIRKLWRDIQNEE